VRAPVAYQAGRNQSRRALREFNRPPLVGTENSIKIPSAGAECGVILHDQGAGFVLLLLEVC